MDNRLQQLTMALQPDLIQVILHLAADTEIVNQDVCARRQRLLMQAYMAVGVRPDHHDAMVAVPDKLRVRGEKPGGKSTSTQP